MKLNPEVRSIFDFVYDDFALDRLRPASAHQGGGRGVTLTLRPARPGDEAVIVELIGALARYEKLERAMEATAADIAAALFADNPRVFCDARGGRRRASSASPCGSTPSPPSAAATASGWRTCSCGRRRAGQRRARRCSAVWRGAASTRGLARFEWSVLDWNEPAIAFYRAQAPACLTTGRVAGSTGRHSRRWPQRRNA